MKLSVLLFSVLIVSISAHDHLKSRHHPHSKHSHLKNRDNSEENPPSNNTQTKCSNGGLQVSYNASTRVEIVYNQKGKVGVVVDSKASLTIIFNDDSKVAIAINLKLKTGVQLRSDNLNGSWSLYLSSQTSLTEVVESRKNSSFNATSPPPEVSQEASSILSNLSTQYGQLPNFISDVQVIVKVTEEFSSNIGSFSTQVSYDLFVVVRRYESLFFVLNRLNATGNSSLDFGKLLPQPTGIDFFRAFLDQLPPGFDITKILGNSTQSTQGFLEFLGQFDCFIRVIANINRARNGSCPPQEVIQSLIEHFRIPYSEGDVQKSIQNLLKTISGRLNGNGSGAGDLSSLNFSDLLPGIANSTTIQNALTNRTANQGFAIFNIISILSSLSGTIPADNSLPNFLGQLFSLFGTTNDTSVLTNLIPRYSDSRFGSVENIVTGFIKIFTTAIQVGAEIAAFFITFPIRFILLPFLAAVSDFFRGLCLPDLLRSQNIIDFFFRGLNVFIRVPISMFSAFIKGITTALEGVGELGGILEGLVNIGGSRTGGCSSIIGNLADREHVHARHSHHERHHSGKGKKHGNKEKKHEVKEKTHELHYKKREVKEKRAGVRERKVEHKKRELHHN